MSYSFLTSLFTGALFNQPPSRFVCRFSRTLSPHLFLQSYPLLTTFRSFYYDEPTAQGFSWLFLFYLRTSRSFVLLLLDPFNLRRFISRLSFILLRFLIFFFSSFFSIQSSPCSFSSCSFFFFLSFLLLEGSSMAAFYFDSFCSSLVFAFARCSFLFFLLRSARFHHLGKGPRFVLIDSFICLCQFNRAPVLCFNFKNVSARDNPL